MKKIKDEGDGNEKVHEVQARAEASGEDGRQACALTFLH